MSYRFAFRRYALPFQAPVRTGHGVWRAREGIVVRLENENGVVGFGEAAPIPEFGTETVDEVEAACREIGPNFDDGRLEAVPGKFGCLRFALDAAQGRFDLAARHAYLPVAALLPAGRAAFEKIGPHGENGFRTFKWKVGVADVADELGMLNDVMARLPSGAKLRLDANGAWDRRRAERWLERCAELPVEFIEQPIAADAKGSVDLLCGLVEDFPTPIALDESVVAQRDIEIWLGRGWPGFFIIKPSLLGDVRAGLAKLHAAKAKVVFSSALETGAGAKAALRVAFAFESEPRALGFGVWPLFVDGRFNGPSLAPFIRSEDVERIDEEAVWNALG